MLPLLFIFSEVFALVFYKNIYRHSQKFPATIHTPVKSEMRIILIDKITIIFIIYLLFHIAFLLYCLYLMFTKRWEPGSMLLILATLETYAVKANIAGVTIKSSQGIVFPTPVFKYFISTMKIFILLHL